MTGPPSRRTSGALSDAERRLWRDAMRDAIPLHKDRAILDEPLEAPPIGEPIPVKAPGIAPSKPKARDLRPDMPIDLDRASAERLRRGQMPIEDRLDLHGMTQLRAHDALLGFIAAGYRAGLRCVLVITGKGWRNDAGSPVGILRQLVPRWLNEAPVRDKILAISHAQPKHGGDGALYVLLKRKRKGRQ